MNIIAIKTGDGVLLRVKKNRLPQKRQSEFTKFSHWMKLFVAINFGRLRLPDLKITDSWYWFAYRRTQTAGRNPTVVNVGCRR